MVPPNTIPSFVDPVFHTLLKGEAKTDTSECKWLKLAELWQNAEHMPSLRQAAALLLWPVLTVQE